MGSDPNNKDDDYDDGVLPPSVYDAEETPEEDLWFLPGPPEDFAPGESPLIFARQKPPPAVTDWDRAERAEYKALVAAAEAVARYGARLAALPSDVVERIALQSVAAILRSEGVWVKPEQIALFRALRISSQEETRDLERASWAVRRLIGMRHGQPMDDGLRAFLGRQKVAQMQELPNDDRALGEELDHAGEDWVRLMQPMGGLHPLTRAACGLFLWRRMQITAPDEALEPMAAAVLIGAGGQAPFLPMPEGMAALHMRASTPEDAVRSFYRAAEQGALAALLEVERLLTWRARAKEATADLSGRTPPSLVETALRFPVFSAELAARLANCAPMSARRNLKLFEERGLLREVTGQQRYRFWTALL
ncbi:helix-turn-helix domain-containing protein [Cognatishimia maritima]|uniref:HTH DNA binding domain-containing protein n=1 Tax=Cognatishimia maritima TaxID=870908 RepID=A0A1M5VVX1_9RHOB|nr:helix-turn-helix domain-containing protein [Cognatishimia maritima]SHH79361.1 HTH DNA binding domain-containing protein [Cognatishimia maritima]